MKKQIKMIGLDCDGTLLNNNKELTEYSREVLLRAIDQGIIVLAATGRPLTGVPEEILKLPGIRYALTSNGARIVDLEKQEVIYEYLTIHQHSKNSSQLLSLTCFCFSENYN